MNILTDERAFARRKLREDFDVYAKNAIKIRPKKTAEAPLVPLTFNEGQKILNKAVVNQVKSEGKIRIIILKARQLGLSTYVGGYFYFCLSQQRGQKAMVVTHEDSATKNLFDMTKRCHDNCPEILKPHTKYASERQLSFDVLDSSYMIATAARSKDSLGRSQTLTHVHASEMAFWPRAKEQALWSGLKASVPDAKGTAIFIESTANGVSGIFHEIWTKAVNGENEYVPVFIPWYVDPEYRAPVPDSFERTPEEEDICKMHGLDDEQLMFRRGVIAENGVDFFKQDYPATPEEAFITTGRPVFNPEELQKRLGETKDVEERLALEGDEWVKNPRGELSVFLKHNEGEQYIIGADVAMGVQGGDYSVACVLDSKKRQVATWRARVHPDYFADVLEKLGEYYNMAYIIVENNGHGILTCTRLGKDKNYPYFHTEVQIDKLTDQETVKLGFTTTTKTKPLIIDELRASLREGEIELNDKVTIREMLTYVVTETGAMSAEHGCFDDCVMAMAFANHVHEGVWEPIPSTDDFYIEMV